MTDLDTRSEQRSAVEQNVDEHQHARRHAEEVEVGEHALGDGGLQQPPERARPRPRGGATPQLAVLKHRVQPAYGVAGKKRAGVQGWGRGGFRDEVVYAASIVVAPRRRHPKPPAEQVSMCTCSHAVIFAW